MTIPEIPGLPMQEHPFDYLVPTQGTTPEDLAAFKRIRDLEREVEKWKLDWRAADQTVRTRNKEVMELEREVERLKPFEAKAERWFSEIEQREADRADAERLQFIFRADSMCATLDEFRSAIDADRAKDPQL